MYRRGLRAVLVQLAIGVEFDFNADLDVLCSQFLDLLRRLAFRRIRCNHITQLDQHRIGRTCRAGDRERHDGVNRGINFMFDAPLLCA